MPLDENLTAASTKVYYYLDDNTPYLSVIPVAENEVTLGDFKKIFTRKGYKYFCKQLDKTIGCEVKVEIRDDSSKLGKSANGLIELVLLSTVTPSGTLPRAVTNKTEHNGVGKRDPVDLKMRKRRSLHELADNVVVNADPLANGCRASMRNSNEDSITASSLSTVISKRAGEGLAELYTSNSEDPYRFDCSNSRFTLNSEACSSAYGGMRVTASGAASCLKAAHRQRRPRKERYRKAYMPSTITSITESSMASLSLPRIEIIKLLMGNGAFLGISVLSNDGGIFVSDIIKGGAVALDGRIEVGDQIVQVNKNSFENLTDAQAVQLLRQAAVSRRPITLYVVKRLSNTDSRSDVLSGLASETLPIDISLWVESAKQNSVKPLKPFATDETNSIVVENTLGEEEHETDMEGAYAERHDRIQIPPTSNKGRTTQVVTTKRGVITAEDVARRRENEENEQLVDSLNITMDPVIILKFMARPDSGLQIKNRKWLKIPVPMSFIGRELVDWLLDHVHGLQDRKAARSFASKLLADGYIRHVVNKLTFTEKCYYVFDDSILSVRSINHSDGSNGKTGAEATTEVTYVGSPAPQVGTRPAVRNCNDSGIPAPLLNNKVPAEIDQTWPVSPITVYGPTQRRQDCDSPVTNDYASVIGPDVVTSTMIGASLTEAPTLKLPRHGFIGRGSEMRRRMDDEIVVICLN
uniref:Segment polarity protein dishevelled n=1 Tax=Parascaris univalens TaxID=6257 RepID=A0A914ZM14_PARUN